MHTNQFLIVGLQMDVDKSGMRLRPERVNPGNNTRRFWVGTTQAVALTSSMSLRIGNTLFPDLIPAPARYDPNLISRVSTSFSFLDQNNVAHFGVLTLMLHTYIGKNLCARAIARHLRLCSPRTGLDVRSSTPRPVRTCAQPHLPHSCAFLLDIGMQH